jgi:small subunit ribosomal protein S1
MEEKQFNETELVEAEEEQVDEVESPEAELPEEERVDEAETPEEEAAVEVETPEAELPEEEAAVEVETPEAELPEEEAAVEVETPEAELPEEEAAVEVEAPEAELPEEEAAVEVETPEAELPEEETAGDVETPEAEAAGEQEPPEEEADEAELQPVAIPAADAPKEEVAGEIEPPEAGESEQQAEDHPMSALLEDALSFRTHRRGEIVDGEIVSVTPTEVLVDVGAKSEGVVPSKELEHLGREGLENLKPGHKLPVYVVRTEDRDGNLILSIRRAEEEHDWRRAQEMSETGEHFEGQVAGFNKGGLIVRLGKLRGFVPASQLAPKHQGSDKQQPEERWSRLVGTPIHVKVIEINRKRKRLILSERAAMRAVREVQKERLLKELRVGEVRKGIVSSLADFGAFIDLGGADGLVHLSELSWNRAAKPRDVLQRGQEVEVYVLNVDQAKKRIALSLKRLEPEPWTTVESRYYVGQLVEGTITRLTNFGAFALVNAEIEGLIHISELAPGRINHPQEVVSEGERHVMRIIRIDPKRRRMGLSLSRVADPAYADLDWRAEFGEAEESLLEEAVDDTDEAFHPPAEKDEL